MPLPSWVTPIVPGYVSLAVVVGDVGEDRLLVLGVEWEEGWALR